ncbi:MAG: MBOAT family protein [Cytophagaceae bacterium]|nr:MBOAT family protein [Cytophagaceae bacterium]MDW8456095.1 MBOAT family O-acyltransferase [Cytophagaceae bacterium]
MISVYYLVPQRLKKYFLLISSYFFYMSWKPEYGALLLFSTVFQYYCALCIEHNKESPRRARKFLWLGVCTDLGMLFTFKYLDFAGSSLFGLANLLGFQLSWPYFNIFLPVGISFYTFQTMSYTIDVYRGHTRAERDFTYFALYVSFFPQLVAGPIERSGNLLPQFREEKKFCVHQFITGGKLILTGFFKKMVVADNLAMYVDKVYHPMYEGTATEYILATWSFIFQVYGDFSGYSDIALGTAAMMGYRLMKNFNQPFFALTVAEFWQRWHISLSSWVKDYIYIPLGGNRKGELRTYINLFISMFTIGVWHGAKWTVVVYALINGISVANSRWLQKKNIGIRPFLNFKIANVFFHRFLTLNVICIPHVYFRSEHVEQANNIMKKIFHLFIHPASFTLPTDIPIIGFTFLTITLLHDAHKENELPLQKIRNALAVKMIYYLFVLYSTLLFGVFRAAQFVYFQF